MGQHIFDQYSLIHFAVGIIAFFWHVKFWTAFALHLMFEYFENTPLGMSLINKYFTRGSQFTWPGGKDKPDSFINSIGDDIVFILGYFTAMLACNMGNKYNLY